MSEDILKRLRDLSQPEEKQEESLDDVLNRRKDMLGKLALLRSANQIGQSIAGGQSGQFKVDQSGVSALENAADQDVKDFKTRQDAKGEKASRKMYRDLLKQQNPQLEVDDDVPTTHLQGLIKAYAKGSTSTKPFQQSQYVTTEGDPVTFDPNVNKYINALSGEDVKAGNVIRNYVKTVTDPLTGEVKEVRPGVGVVGTVAGAPKKAPTVVSESDRKDYTYEMLNKEQRKGLTDARKEYLKDIDDSREFGEVLMNVKSLIDSDISAAIPAIKRQLARSVGKEVGVMTDADVAAFSGDQSLVGALERFAKLQATGKMTDEDKSQFMEIVSIAEQNLDRGVENRAKFHIGGLKNRLPDATEQSVRSLLSVEDSKPETSNPKLEQAKAWLEQNPDHPRAAEVQAKIQRMMGQ